MSKYIPGNQKHLTLNDRIYIENELAKGTPCICQDWDKKILFFSVHILSNPY